MEEELIVLVLEPGNKGKLKEFCFRHDIPLTYPNLFVEEKEYHLWGISKSGVGLVDTFVCRGHRKNGGKFCYSIEELEEYFNAKYPKSQIKYF